MPINQSSQNFDDYALPTEEIEAPPEQPTKLQNYDKYVLPTSEYLNPPPPRIQVKEEEARAIARELEEKTREFNATGRVVNICPGPVVTTYEYKPDLGVKYSRITGLADDLCLALKAESIRIDRIPGKASVGIEVPNRERDTIFLREVVESKKFVESKSLLTIALGKTIDGLNYVTDLAKMPHLLIAGATGAGKSVCVNTLVVSILYKAKPDEVKFIMVDLKRLELGVYADIPHLATPTITDPKRAASSLKWAVSEMEKRYKDLAGWGVRNIDGFNAEVKRRNANEQFDDNGESFKTLPYIVIVIDEFADLMMTSDKEVEESIIRLAQTARAAGIHLVLATEKPSSDIINGLIKANFTSRIAFRVPARIDSRTILDINGAEKLLGYGDMLFSPPNTADLVRVHGAFVDEKEIHKIVEHVKEQGRPEYETTITKTEDELVDSDDLPGKKDILFADALRTVVSSKRASTSLLQRHLRIGYGRAAAILDAMVREGYIGEMDSNARARPILQKAYEHFQELNESSSLPINEISDANKTQNNGYAVFLAITFLVITILLAGLSYGYCQSPSRANYHDGNFEALRGFVCLIGSVITGFITLFFLGMASMDDKDFSQPTYSYPTKKTNYKGGRRGRPIKLFRKSKKSSIIKTIKREIKKYGD